MSWANAVGFALRVLTDEFGLHRAEASAHLKNLPSQRVLRRHGFSPYGVAHFSLFLDGSRRDGLLWERVLGDRGLAESEAVVGPVQLPPAAPKQSRPDGAVFECG
ncbi:GNAT family N-acetyltransferase [Streptomyces sp. NPDC060022]|uniref:GNAT family N-acetyltransferase n=1 Tax=Streptomyces sp. NPDC060022 TaxID=3347039 RepID=UPI0036A10922